MEIKGVIQPLAGKGQPAAAVGAGVVHLGGAQAGAVAALFKQMRLARHPGPVQGADQQQGVLHPDRIPEGTHAGQLARLDLYSHDAATEGFIPVPNSAVVKVGVNDVVFIKAGNDTFVMKKVETLPSRQGKTPVKGLMPGQTIVTKGGYELKYILPTGEAGSKKAAGHFHADGQFHEGEH